MAAQLTGIKTPPLRELWLWMYLASTSLPAPVSPVSRMLLSAGEIRVTLSCKRHAVLEVVNSYAAVGEADLDRLFDRFYRSDKARTSGSGFGIGLSIAQATASAHRATLSAYRAGSSEIGFRVVFRE